MFKKLNYIFFFISILLINSNVFAQDKIAFIDLNYLYNNSTAGKKINNQIEDKRKKINSEFQQGKKKIDGKKEKLLSQRNVIEEVEFKKKFVQLEDEIKEFNIKISNKQKEISKFNNKAKIEFSNKLRLILEDFSKENSIAMIIRKENLLIGKSNLDVTKNILDLLNKKVKEIKVN